ncbi:MAG: hypothetical protein CMB31_00495 [Euryarchaeota archaeon]|nr:hypothetical protein [Euryarchaeota archaeon]|tara:strand:- start:1079 stop:1687 length:609 start_codon:yes stop_codon:yes gene_type:complete
MQQIGLKVIVVLCTLLLVGCIGSESTTSNSSPYNGHEWTGANPAPLFTLESMNGSLWSLEEERGKTVVLAFTYTRCYSTCPVISHSLSTVYSELSSFEKENITFVSVTIDPWHDSPTVLQEWTEVNQFNWTHLTGSPDAVVPVLNEFGVGPIGFEDQSEEGYGFNHTQPTYIIDRNGNVRVLWDDADLMVDFFLEDLRLVAE